MVDRGGRGVNKVRWGGYQGRDAFVFELDGGRLCLDLVNTLDERLGPAPRERLRTYVDLADWSVQAGVFDSAERNALVEEARRSPRRAGAALGKARRLRETLFEIFSCAIVGRPARPAALHALEVATREAFARPRLLRSKNVYRLDWQTHPRALDRMLNPVVRSAVELISSKELSRVRRCASDTCAWLFLDETKNRSRRWCDMTVCGNRAKARRFYRKQRRRVDS